MTQFHVSAPPTAGTPVPAVVQRGYGPIGVFHLADHPVPDLGPTDVLVAVAAAAVDRGTWHLMTGTPTMIRPAIGLRTPRNPVPGRDLAGIVAAVGDRVTEFGPGDHVHGTANGSLTTFAVTSQDRLALMPTGCSFEHAAAMPVSGLTAFQGLVDVARVTAGQQVLVTGASGGVGTFAVQIAAALGADVTASCRTDAAARVGSLGATRVIDRTKDDPFGEPDRYDVILDIAGRPPVRTLRRALRRGGTAVIVGGEGGSAVLGGMSRQLRAVAVSPFVPERLTMFVAKERGTDLARLDELVADRRVTPLIDSVYPLDRVDDAMERLASGDVVGKVVVTVAGDS